MGARVSLEGKVASVREQQQLQVDGPKGRIVRAQGQVAQGGTAVQRDWVHQKRRRLGNLKAKLEKLEPTSVVVGCGCASSPGSSGGSSTTWRATATPVMMNGWGTGELPKQRVLRAGE